MILSRMTWKEVAASSREAVVLLPTGSLEQHGAHLPVFTDSLIVTAIAEAVEAALPNQVILTPTFWLGASGHHLTFAGTLSSSFEAYESSLISAIESLLPHNFTKFYLLNGHGGNTEPNGIVCRKIKEAHPNITIGHSGYFAFCEEVVSQQLQGPSKRIQHACEAETSIMLALHPDLVRTDLLRDDGLVPDPAIQGVVHTFAEMTQEGSLGYATLASPDKGRAIVEAAVRGVTAELQAIAEGYVLHEIPARS